VSETGAVSVPGGDAVIGSGWLSRVLEASPAWANGQVRVLSAAQIGVERGLSGRVHRVLAETERGGSVSFVVKQETADAVERELHFRAHCGELVRGCIPDLLCGQSDAASERGVLVLEDIAPAEQGDVLYGCTDEEAEAVLRVLARLHGGSWKVAGDGVPAGVPRWRVQPMEPDRWRDRLARATERFPAILAPRISSRMLDLPERAADAGGRLSQGPASWIHVDAHLDNTLFRPDGTVVLVDWCNAAIGPPVVDLARFLTEGVIAPSQSERVTGLLSVYVEELSRAGVDVPLPEVHAGFGLALLPLLQGAVGWAGRDDLERRGRSAVVCKNFLQSMCGWALDRAQPSACGRRPQE
jgi:Phosphotransferase enzyme family